MIIDSLLNTLAEMISIEKMSECKDFFDAYKDTHCFIIASDYCMADKNKINDTMSFIVYGYPEIEDIISATDYHLPADIKKTSFISDKHKYFLSKANYLSLNLVFEKNKVFKPSNGNETIEEIQNQMRNTLIKKNAYINEGLLKGNKLSEKEVNKRINRLIQKTIPKTFNKTLFIQSYFLGRIIAYIAYILTTVFIDTKQIVWIPDRDDMTNCNDKFCFDLFDESYISFYKKPMMLYHCIEDPTYNTFKFDQFIRLPDYLAGTFASRDFVTKQFTEDKFEDIMKFMTKNNVNFKISIQKKYGYQVEELLLRRTYVK